MKKYKMRKYAVTYRSKSMGITLTDLVFAETKAQAYLFLQNICYKHIATEYQARDFIAPSDVFYGLNDRWELVSLKWVRPVRPFDLSINKE